MSTPEPHVEPEANVHARVVHQPAEARRSRAQQVRRWASFHRAELAVTALPTVAALWSWWWLLGTVAAAALWVVHEQRVRHRKGGDAQ